MHSSAFVCIRRPICQRYAPRLDSPPPEARLRSIDLSTNGLESGSRKTPFSTFLWAVVSGDIATAESRITDDIEWGLMPYNKVLNGKSEVIPWLRAGYSSQKEPVVISNVATRDWGGLLSCTAPPARATRPATNGRQRRGGCESATPR